MSALVANRVKLGEFLESGLRVETSAELIEIHWDDVVFLYFGKVNSKGSFAPVRAESKDKLGKGLASLALGPLGPSAYNYMAKKGRNAAVPLHEESFFLMDLYISKRAFALRFEPRGTNFRKFLLADAVFSGEINLLNFVRKISQFIEKSLDSSVVEFLSKGKNHVHAFSSLDEFTWTSLEKYKERMNALQTEKRD